MIKEKIIVLGGGLVGRQMARTTGYTATAAVRMLIEGLYKEPGIAPPELVRRPHEPRDFMIRCLRERRVICEEEVMGGSPILGSSRGNRHGASHRSAKVLQIDPFNRHA